LSKEKVTETLRKIYAQKEEWQTYAIPLKSRNPEQKLCLNVDNFPTSNIKMFQNLLISSLA
jgi:hypothetical protein